MKFYKKTGIPLPKGRSSGMSQRVFILYIIAIIVVNTALILIYRHYFQKELDKEMKEHVAQSVSQYVALSDIATLESQGLTDREEVKEMDREELPTEALDSS